MIKKYGIIAIVGKPNVGKSTLINAITKTKAAIVSPKPQTTRNSIKELYEDEDSVIIFTDTPGFHEPKNKLDIFLNNEIEISYKEADLIYFLTNMEKPLTNDDFQVIDFLKEANKNVILVVSKAETSKTQDLIDERVNELKSHFNFIDIVQISSLHNINLDKLISLSKKFLKQDIVTDYFRQKADKEDSFIIAEIIREQCLKYLNHEIPHGIGVEVNDSNYDKEKNLWVIKASLLIEKKSHKQIVIGKNGDMIKKISKQSRIELQSQYDCKIHLELFVQIEDDWRNNQNKVKNLGYKIKK